VGKAEESVDMACLVAQLGQLLLRLAVR